MVDTTPELRRSRQRAAEGDEELDVQALRWLEVSEQIEAAG